MKKITSEEHFTTTEHMDTLIAIIEDRYTVAEVAKKEKILAREAPFIGLKGNRETPLSNMLKNIGEGRIQEMDKHGIDMQILSLVSPGIQILDVHAAVAMAKQINNELAKAVKKYPRRFAGLATIAPQDPEAAADELERAVKKLGLRGACINSHTRGEYLDNKKFWAIFETAEKLDVPIYLHPRAPSPDMVKPYLDYPSLETAMCGFAHEVSLHSLRLIYSGVFDKYPKLKIVLGHLGEALPFWLQRLDSRFKHSPLRSILKKYPSQYIKDNFYVTTSGMFWQPALIFTYLALGADRILLAVDYPFESNEEAGKFIDEMPISDGDKEKISHLNAEKILGL